MHITYRCVQNAAFTGLPSCVHMLSGKSYKQALLFITCLNPIILLLSVIFNGVGRFVVLSLTPLAIVFKSILRRLPKTGRKWSNYRRDKNIQTAPIPTYCKQKQVSKLSGNDSSTSQISSKTSR